MLLAQSLKHKYESCPCLENNNLAVVVICEAKGYVCQLRLVGEGLRVDI
jgi:hypothetical protein